MNLRNLLRLSDFVIPMPYGINMTIQYNGSGNLEKLYLGLDSDRVEVTDKLLDLFLKHNTVPAKIHLNHGTSWVYGTLYTGQLLEKDGRIDVELIDALVALYCKNPSQFNFFAVNVESTCLSITGQHVVRQFLVLAKFKTLHGWAIPNGFTEDMFDSWIYGDYYPFVPICKSLCIFRGNSTDIIDIPYTQQMVKEVRNYVDANGYVKTYLYFNDQSKRSVDYPDIVRWNIHAGSLIIVDSTATTVHCKPNTDKTYTTTYTCPYCGKKSDVPESGSMRCKNDHCVTQLPFAIEQFCRINDIDAPSRDQIKNWVDSKQLTCMPDILLLEPYKDMSIDVPLHTLLRSVISISKVPSQEVISQFCMACGDNLTTVEYYLNNPELIQSELGVSHRDTAALVNYLSDQCNVSDILTMLNSNQVHIVSTRTIFKGAPIFRDKTICITGDFVHGDTDTIIGILKSYSANVTTTFTNVIDCVVVGDTKENINGKIVFGARSIGIPIFDEGDFFSRYEIDDDIRNSVAGEV